jgi:hypothetical protein
LIPGEARGNTTDDSADFFCLLDLGQVLPFFCILLGASSCRIPRKRELGEDFLLLMAGGFITLVFSVVVGKDGEKERGP